MNLQGFLDQIKAFFKKNNMFTNLIWLNVIVFVVVVVFNVSATLMKINNPLVTAVLSTTSDIGGFIRRPWSIITYMFTHQSFRHILGNLLMFYFFGRYLFNFLGSRKLLSTYLIGGVAGWVAYVLGYNFLPALEGAHGYMIGASASVMACVIAAATYAPNLKINLIFIQVEFKYLAALWVITDIYSLGELENAGGYMAHLGGALYGFLMIKQLQKGNDINAWFERLIDRVSNLFKRNPKMKVVYKRPEAATQSDEEYNYTQAQAQQKVDAILDKIANGGYGSLTKAEKAFLNKYSAK